MNKFSINEFNEKYDITNLNKKNFVFISSEYFKTTEKKQLSGKPQSIWIDIIKRFFSNKWNIFFSLILIALIILTFIAPLLSSFSFDKPISSTISNISRYNKPSWSKEWNHVNTNVEISDFWNYFNHDGIGPFDKGDVVSHHIVNDAFGKPIQMHVNYINRFATKTILGTDSLGRDVWTRLFVGAQWSLSLAVLVATIETVFGTMLGIYIGYHVGSRIDTLSMRFVEIFQSVPGLLWMFIFALILGTSFWSMVFVLIIVGWVGPLYTARMFTLKIKDAEFIKAARSIGASKSAILFKHILPNIVGRLLVSFVHRIPSVIFAETTLVFLGMTVGGETQTSIGNLISDARSLDAINLNIMYATSISLYLLLFSISLQIIANGIRDAFDPRTGGR